MSAPRRPEPQVPYPWQRAASADASLPPAVSEVPTGLPTGHPPAPGIGPLRYVAFGGALVGAFMATIAAGSKAGMIPIVVGAAAGQVAGHVGRVIIATLAARGGSESAGGTRRAALLTLFPAYLVAGVCGAAVAGLVAGMGPGDVLASGPGITVALLVAYVLIAPLSLAFAPGEPSRPKVIGGSIAGFSGTFWVAGFAVVWLPGSLAVMLAALAGLQSLSPSVAGSPLFLLAWLAGWLVAWIGGAVAVHRLVRGVLTRKASARDR